ncbi:DUF45 domain-containing protein [Rhodobacterales bacterium HKCCE2091]|nr:DUF45 domain-containing protein [Rhodobacterales bacterium HKCCE2091]
MARRPSAQTEARTHVLPGDPPIEVALRRSARARRFSLRVSRADGRVSLSLPVWAREAEALAFLREREAWLRAHVDAAPGIRAPRVGGTVPLLGADRPVLAGPGRSARFEDGAVRVPDDARAPARIKALFVAMARERLAAAVAVHTAALGRGHGRLTIRDTRSRWGSCTTAGDLMFSWRLVMAPPPVLDYVAAHEVAHLAEMNHSPAYWAVCARLCPDYKRQRRWLRDNGPDLLAWRFDADAG